MVSLHSVLIAVTLLIFNVRNQGMPEASRKLRWFFIPLHIAFVSALICGATRELGAFCSPTQAFPWVFAAPGGLILLVMILFANLYQLDFLVDWEPPADAEARKKYGSESRVGKIRKVF